MEFPETLWKQFADGFSRNPEKRDRVRPESEEKSHMPKTLAEASEVVTKGRLQGDLIDDAESITQLIGASLPTRYSHV